MRKDVMQATSMAPRTLARVGGILYLIIITLGVFEEMFVRSRLIVAGDAAKTAANLISHELLWRLGIAAELVLLSCATALTIVFLVLLGRVSQPLAWLATLFNLMAVAVEAVAAVNLAEALFPLGEASYLQAFEPAQLHALSRLASRSHAHGFGVALVFFGWCALLLGVLIYRSGFLPRVLGALMGVAGVCYLINSFALIVAPAVANRLFPAILIPAFVAELSLAMWLLVKGVDVERYRAAEPPSWAPPRERSSVAS
jgi:hypothetical protein